MGYKNNKILLIKRLINFTLRYLKYKYKINKKRKRFLFDKISINIIIEDIKTIKIAVTNIIA